MLRPIGYILERRCLDAAPPPLGFFALRYETGSFQHPKMLGDGRSAHLKRLGKFAHGTFAGNEAGEDGPAGWVGERSEGGAELVAHLCNLMVN